MKERKNERGNMANGIALVLLVVCFSGCTTHPPVIQHPQSGHVNPGAILWEKAMEKRK